MTSRTKYPICADLTEQTDSNEAKITAKRTIYDMPKEEGKRIAIIFGGREATIGNTSALRRLVREQ